MFQILSNFEQTPLKITQQHDTKKFRSLEEDLRPINRQEVDKTIPSMKPKPSAMIDEINIIYSPDTL